MSASSWKNFRSAAIPERSADTKPARSADNLTGKLESRSLATAAPKSIAEVAQLQKKSHWKKYLVINGVGAISTFVVLMVFTVTKFRPEQASLSEGRFWASMEELLPVFAREGVELRLEPHPDDFVEDGKVAIDMVRGINSPLVSFLYCAPHTFHQGGNMVEILEYAGPLLTHLHLADSFDHTASSGLRYIMNPPGTQARIHQHLDIGQGEVDWELFFRTLDRLGFDGIMTSCVFAWEDRARASTLFMREQIAKHTSTWGPRS